MKMKKKSRPPLVGRGLDGQAYGQHHKQQHKTGVEHKNILDNYYPIRNKSTSEEASSWHQQWLSTKKA